MRSPKGRLVLMWMGENMAIIPFEESKCGYEWVGPADSHAFEVQSLDVVKIIGEAGAPTPKDGVRDKQPSSRLRLRRRRHSVLLL